MMAQTLLRLQATRAITSIASRSSRAATAAAAASPSSNGVHMSRMMFSAQPELTPGIGLGKTSTGLVSYVWLYVVSPSLFVELWLFVGGTMCSSICYI